MLRRKRQDIGNLAGWSAERELWHAVGEKLRLRVGTDVDDVLPGALPPLFVRNWWKDAHDRACDTASLVAAEDRGARKSKYERLQEVAMTIVRDSVRIRKRLVSGREAGGQTDAHASAIAVGRLERIGVDGFGAAGEELAESTDSGAGIEPSRVGPRWRQRGTARARGVGALAFVEGSVPVREVSDGETMFADGVGRASEIEKLGD